MRVLGPCRPPPERINSCAAAAPQDDPRSMSRTKTVKSDYRYKQTSDTPLLTVPVGHSARHLLQQHALDDIRRQTAQITQATMTHTCSFTSSPPSILTSESGTWMAPGAWPASPRTHPTSTSSSPACPQVLTPGPTCADELLHGRAGTLYCVLAAHHAPLRPRHRGPAGPVNPVPPDHHLGGWPGLQVTREALPGRCPRRYWHCRTQLVLAMPSLAAPPSLLEDNLRGLLAS